MKLIHVQTQITTVLGWLDDDDNVTETVTLQGAPTNLTDEAWIDVARGLRDKRAELLDEHKAFRWPGAGSRGSAASNGKAPAAPANRAARRAAVKAK